MSSFITWSGPRWEALELGPHDEDVWRRGLALLAEPFDGMMWSGL